MKIDSLVKKIFLMTFAVISVFILIFSLLLYYVFPIVYQGYLDEKIIDVNNQVVSELEQNAQGFNQNEIKSYISDIGTSTGVDIRLFSINEVTNRATLIYSPYTQILSDYSLPEFSEKFEGNNRNNVDISDEFYLNGNMYRVQTSYDERNIINIREAMKYLVPYFFVMILVVTVFISILFSLFVSRPITRLSKKSKQFSNLDFTIDNVRYGSDEIGQLNRDLDQMGIHLKLAINKLNHDVELATKLEEERRNQLAIMSHELKTPLTIIKGQLEMMIANVGKYKDRDFYLNESLDKVNKMQGLISDILLTSDIESMDKLKNATSYNVVEKISKTIEEIKLLNDEIVIHFEHDEEELVINANPVIFDQIIKNIIENAIKYSEDNQGIEISFKNRILTVQNYNSKVTTEELHELFEPYKRKEKSRNSSKGGHGLGLYIVEKGLSIHNFKYSFTVLNNIVTFMIDFNIEEN